MGAAVGVWPAGWLAGCVCAGPPVLSADAVAAAAVSAAAVAVAAAAGLAFASSPPIRDATTARMMPSTMPPAPPPRAYFADAAACAR